MSKRPEIPEPIKREVRQQCSFGCAICGSPVFQYDHIEEYSVVKEHTVENLVLLCPNHHNDKTTKKMSKERVNEAKRNPFNSGQTFTSPYRMEPNRVFYIKIGTNVADKNFINGNGDYSCLWINGGHFMIIHANDGWLTFSARLTDDTAKPILVIDHGELVVNSGLWDFKYEGSEIIIRDIQRRILLQMTITNENMEVKYGLFLHPSGDGYIVNHGALFTIYQGKVTKTSTDCYFSGGYGGWGLLNTNIFPEEGRPTGFGSFQTI